MLIICVSNRLMEKAGEGAVDSCHPLLPRVGSSLPAFCYRYNTEIATKDVNRLKTTK